MNMEFLRVNYLNTSTMVTVNAGTSSVAYLYDRNKTNRYQSSGLNDDTTACTLTVTFDTASYVDRIVLENMNLKSFKIYHSSNAANTITLIGSDTTTSEWSANSDTSKYLHFTTINATSITIVATTTISANEEKKIGELWISKQYFALDINPDASSYNPKLERKEYTHEAAAGGWVNYIIAEYYTAEIKLDYKSPSMTALLKDLYDTGSSFAFVPFPTGTGWDGRIYECNWIGDWSFDKPAGNDYISLGYNGSISLRETPR